MKWDPMIAIDVTRGISEGFGIDVPDRCLDTSKTVITNFEDIVDKLRTGEMSKIVEALDDAMEEMTVILPELIAYCGQVAEKGERAIQALMQYKSLKDFTKHLAHDVVQNAMP